MGLKLETLMYLSSCSVRLLVRVSDFFFILFFFSGHFGTKIKSTHAENTDNPVPESHF